MNRRKVLDHVKALHRRTASLKTSNKGPSVLENASWLVSEKISQMAISLAVGIAMARYLGPEQFGMLSYSTAFISLFLGISSLGLNSILLRDIATGAHDERELLGTTFALQLVSGVTAYIIALCIAALDSKSPSLQLLLIACAGSVLVLNSFRVIEVWLQANSQAKRGVWVSTTAVFAGAALKIYLMATQAPLGMIGLTFLIEGVFVAGGLVIVYGRSAQKLTAWRVRLSRGREMLRDGWPLMLSGVVILIYIRTDQILIRQMLGNEALGIYSIATKLTECWYFIPTAIGTAMFPRLAKIHREDTVRYASEIERLCRIAVTLGLAIAVPATIFAAPVINLVFGSKYGPAADVLRIYIWASLFVFLGAVSSQWFIHERLQKYSLYRNAAGAVLNIALNLILIPQLGLKGSAIATFLAVFVASFAANVASHRTRILFTLQRRALGGAFRGQGFIDLWRVASSRLRRST